MADDMIRFRPSPELAADLRSRRERMIPPEPSDSLQARLELDLWRAVRDGELARVRLTLAQARCLADVAGGPLIRPGIGDPMGRMFAACYAAFKLARSGRGGDVSSYGAKHGIDEQALLDVLAGLGPAADHALEDALSRWWAGGQPRDGLQWRDGGEWDAASAEGFAMAGIQVTG